MRTFFVGVLLLVEDMWWLHHGDLLQGETFFWKFFIAFILVLGSYMSFYQDIKELSAK